MDYHQNLPTAPHQMNTFNNTSGGLNLPDSSSSNEKALMWSATTYMCESGYSTQAPSIIGMESCLNNDHGMDGTLTNLDNNSTLTNLGSSKHEGGGGGTFTELQSSVQQQNQHPTEMMQNTEEENAVANWINYQDNVEMAIKAIPELLKLLRDEDLVVVQQAALIIDQMVRNEGPRIALIQVENAVKQLVDCLNTTADLDTARSIVGALYGISLQKPAGVQAIIKSDALIPLVKMLSAPTEKIITYAITSIHNVLLECDDKVKHTLRKLGAVYQMIGLLQLNQNEKFLSIVIDCLVILTYGNLESKKIFYEYNGTPLIVNILLNYSSNYPKLLLNTVRLLKVISACTLNKPALINMNVIQALSSHLIAPQFKNAKPTQKQNVSAQTIHDIVQNCLVILRNLSDSAIRLNGLEQLIQNLIHLLSNQNSNVSLSNQLIAAQILSNLCINENYKKLVVRSDGISLLLKIIEENLFQNNFKLIEPSLCILRNLTTKHSDMLLAQEHFRSKNGMELLSQLVLIKPRPWSCVKALLGVVRSICTNQMNAQYLRSNSIIEKLMQVLFDSYTEINNKTNNGLNINPNTNLVVKVDDVNLVEIIDGCAAALSCLAKDYQNQIIMKKLDCIRFFAQMFCSPILNNQKAASNLLAELAMNQECADVIEQQPGLHQYIQMNYFNQFGQLKSISELTNQNATIVLQHVTTLLNRLQEHKTRQTNNYIQQQQGTPQPGMIRNPQQQQQPTPSTNLTPQQQPPQQQQQPQFQSYPPPMQPNLMSDNQFGMSPIQPNHHQQQQQHQSQMYFPNQQFPPQSMPPQQFPNGQFY